MAKRAVHEVGRLLREQNHAWASRVPATREWARERQGNNNSMSESDEERLATYVDFSDERRRACIAAVELGGIVALRALIWSDK